MNAIVVSDDLSGAAGMASIIGKGIPVISYANVKFIEELNAKIISIDLETRNSDNTIERLEILKRIQPDAMILTRIDTMLRGSTSDFIKFMARTGKLLITDTIPEYGRYTCNGRSIYGDDIMNINNSIPEQAKDIAMIADSKTYKDIKKLARVCINENLLPVDPGILIKMFLEMI